MAWLIEGLYVSAPVAVLGCKGFDSGRTQNESAREGGS